jgi:RNA polymerase sigma-70 factor (ECF subfamily)
MSAVERAQRGDAGAFRELYEEHVGRVYAICLRMSGDNHEAEELTQRVFIRAWDRLESFRGESLFSTWLHRLTVNEALGVQRATQRRVRRVQPSEDIEGLDGPAIQAPPGVRLDLDRAIAALPPGARQVFVLHDVEGYEHEEIARLTGIAAGTSKAQLHRARRLLREALER